MTLHTAPPEVLTISDARNALSTLADASHSLGVEADIVFCGPHRRPDLTIIPTELFKLVAPMIEDLLLRRRIAERLLTDNAARGMSLAEFDDEFGVTPEALAGDGAQYEADIQLTGHTVA